MTDSTPRSRGRLAWFAAEFLVVVTGVLTALLMQSFWQSQSDRRAERTYLQLLLADLRETEADLLFADSASRKPESAGARLLEANQSPTPVPPDSVLNWLLAMRPYQNPRPTLGAFEALVNTGDLRLIRDPSLRASITGYLDETRGAIESSMRSIEMVNGQYLELNRQVDYAELLLACTTCMPTQPRSDSLGLFRFARPGARRGRFPVNAEALLSNREVYSIVTSLQITKRQLFANRGRVLLDSRELRRQIEEYLAND